MLLRKITVLNYQLWKAIKTVLAIWLLVFFDVLVEILYLNNMKQILSKFSVDPHKMNVDQNCTKFSSIPYLPIFIIEGFKIIFSKAFMDTYLCTKIWGDLDQLNISYSCFCFWFVNFESVFCWIFKLQEMRLKFWTFIPPIILDNSCKNGKNSKPSWSQFTHSTDSLKWFLNHVFALSPFYLAMLLTSLLFLIIQDFCLN